MHLLHERAKEAEVMKSGGAESGAVGGGMHVGDVGANGEMDGDGDAVLVSVDEDAGICVLELESAAGKELAGSFAVANANARGELGEFVEVAAGFLGHAKLTGAETGFDVFGGVAGERDFEIVDEGGAVHGDSRDEAAAHEIDEDGTETDFDDVAAEAPENGAALFAGAMDGGEKIVKVFGGEDFGKGIEEFCEGGIRSGRFGEVASADFAFARSERVGVDGAERDGLD